MKYLKMLGLAAIAAMGLMAFLGASSASATVLCSTPVHEGCGEWDYAAGTTIHVTLTAGTSAILEDTSGNTLVTCTESTVHGTTSNTGGTGAAVTGNIGALTWGSASTPCTQTTDTLTNGSLSVEAGAGTNGTLSGSTSKVTVSIFGVSCAYGTGAGTTLGTVTGGNPATVSINAVINKQEGGFLCPSTTKWTGSYTVTAPKPLYIATN